MQPFFPNLAFAIVFVGILALGLACASWIDWHTARIPNRLTMSLLACGLLLNAVRGTWMAAQGVDGWLPSAGSPLLGTLDGLLFALSGAAVGFGLFFLMWIFSVAGGGDAKLATAIGGWFGAKWIVGSIVLALPFLMLIALLSLGYRLIGGRLPKSFAAAPLPGHPQVSRRFMGYALPLTLGAYLILFALMKGYLDYREGLAAAPG
ncbi:MAG TPA: A24 family peptidase [Urbifossiella sp.]|jgi:Flp pilus assembly protein protease CpaA